MAEFVPGPYKAGGEVTVNGVIWIARKDIKFASALPKAGAYWMLKPEPVVDKDAVIAALNILLKESDSLLNLTVTDKIKGLIQPPITLRMLGHLIYQQGKEPEPVPNTAPTANAGTGSEITLPVSSVQANGSGSDLEGPVTYSWKQLIGPKPAVISNATIPNPVFSEMTLAGTYSFELTVTDAGGLKATSTVIYTVKPEPVIEPEPGTGIPLPDYTDYETTAFTSPGTPVTLKTTIAAIPTQISNLKITGTPLVGQTLTAVTDSAGTYTYQWIITDANGQNPAFMEGQTANTYTLVAGDAGFRFAVQATNSEGLTVTSLKTQTVEAPKNWISENMVYNTTGQTFRSTRGILGNGKLEFRLGSPNTLSGYVGGDQGTYYPQNIFEADFIFTLYEAATGKGFTVREKAGSNIFATSGNNLITYFWEVEQEVLTATTSKIRYKFKKQQGDLSVTIWESKRVGNPSIPLYFVAYLEPGQTVTDGKLWAESGKIVNVS